MSYFRRRTEATDQQLVASGAAGGLGAYDPVDGDYGFQAAGSGGGGAAVDGTGNSGAGGNGGDGFVAVISFLG